MTIRPEAAAVESTEARAESESDDTGVDPQEPIPYTPPRRPLNCDSNWSGRPPWYQ
jgi:hypothetical protein